MQYPSANSPIPSLAASRLDQHSVHVDSFMVTVRRGSLARVSCSLGEPGIVVSTCTDESGRGLVLIQEIQTSNEGLGTQMAFEHLVDLVIKRGATLSPMTRAAEMRWINMDAPSSPGEWLIQWEGTSQAVGDRFPRPSAQCIADRPLVGAIKYREFSEAREARCLPLFEHAWHELLRCRRRACTLS